MRSGWPLHGAEVRAAAQGFWVAAAGIRSPKTKSTVITPVCYSSNRCFSESVQRRAFRRDLSFGDQRFSTVAAPVKPERATVLEDSHAVSKQKVINHADSE
jgi:hypothetical protein